MEKLSMKRIGAAVMEFMAVDREEFILNMWIVAYSGLFSVFVGLAAAPLIQALLKG